MGNEILMFEPIMKILWNLYLKKKINYLSILYEMPIILRLVPQIAGSIVPLKFSAMAQHH